MINDHKERGVVLVHVIIEDSPDDGTDVDQGDAAYWAYQMDFNGNATKDHHEILKPEEVIVLADVGRNAGCTNGLWDRFTHDCGSDIYCQFACKVTPQVQILDQGGVTVDDPCAWRGGLDCGQCGYPEARVNSVLEDILPAKWCGEAIP